MQCADWQHDPLHHLAWQGETAAMYIQPGTFTVLLNDSLSDTSSVLAFLATRPH